MSYQTYLQEIDGFFTHTRSQCGASARAAVLKDLRFIVLLFLLAPGLAYGAASCGVSIVSVMAAPEVTAATRPSDGDWQAVELPDFWQSRWPSAHTVWYRMDWRHDCGAFTGRAEASDRHTLQNIALSVNSISMAGEIYLNDSLLWRDRNLQEPFSRSWNMPRIWMLPESALTGDLETLWIRVTGMPYDRLWLGHVRIGDYASTLAYYERERWLKRDVFVLNMAFSLALACLFFAIWLVRRQETAFGWFALASLSWSLFAATMLASSPWPFSSSADWNRLVSMLFASFSCAFCLFTWAFGKQTFPRLQRLLPALAVVLSVSLWWVPDAQHTLAIIVFMLVFIVIFFGNCVQFIVYTWRQPERYNVLLAMCLAGFLLVGLHDILVLAGLGPSGNLLAAFTSPLAMLFMFLIIADRFARNFSRIEHFNVELQQAVTQARQDLQEKLEHQHELELSNIRLAERLQLSHDLHDSLGGSLVRSIASVEQSAAPLDNSRFLSMLKELRDDLRQLIDSTSGRTHAVGESPQEWIAPVRQRFVRLFEELGLQSSWDLPKTWPCILSTMQKIELLRMIEEALSNAIKHSRADCIRVTMEARSDGGLILSVNDNGVGFDVDTARLQGGVGMRSLQARARRIGGQLQISATPEGSVVQVLVLSPR